MENSNSQVKCGRGGLIKLAKLLALCEALSAVREDVQLEGLDVDEASGAMVLHVGDVLVYAEVRT